MSIFDYLMQDSIRIRRLNGTNSSGTKTYDPPRGQDPAVIKGRLAYHRKTITKADGQEYVSEAVLLTSAPIATGDLVIHDGREWVVQALSDKMGLFGGLDHREARL